MSVESLESHSLQRLVERQSRELESRRKELLQARKRIDELEDALRQACEYSEVCRHFPAAKALLKDSGDA